MTLEEFCAFRDVVIRDAGHERVVRRFYPLLQSVSGDARALPDALGPLLGRDLSGETVVGGCFNGVNDGSTPPYPDVDFFVRTSGGTVLYIYGRPLTGAHRALAAHEHIVIV